MKNKLYLLLDNIRSAYNTGSIIRTAEFFGVDRIIFCGITPDISNKKVLKTSLGAEKYIELENQYFPWKAVDNLKKQGFYIISLENNIKGAKNIFKIKPKYPLLLVLGNEIKGVSNSVIKRSDEIVFIPKIGKKESLNVAIAAGIAIFYLKFYEKFK